MSKKKGDNYFKRTKDRDCKVLNIVFKGRDTILFEPGNNKAVYSTCHEDDNEEDILKCPKCGSTKRFSCLDSNEKNNVVPLECCDCWYQFEVPRKIFSKFRKKEENENDRRSEI